MHKRIGYYGKFCLLTGSDVSDVFWDLGLFIAKRISVLV